MKKNSITIKGELAQGGPLIACIDMGTNSFHMIVCQASPQNDHFEIISRVREPVPFFRKSLVNHYIDEPARRSVLRILKDMRNLAIKEHAAKVIAVATSAVRESRNGQEILNLIKDELDIDARMISGREEARLIYLGVLWSMPNLNKRFCIVDIGGGSSELIVGDRHNTFFAESYKLGAARLTEQFWPKGKPSKEAIRAMHQEVQGILLPASTNISKQGGFEQLIGTSGTVQSLAKLALERSRKKDAEIHGFVLTIEVLQKLLAEIEETYSNGLKIGQLSADRNETILAGAIVLYEVMRTLDCRSITVASAALREGVVVDRFLQTGWLDAGLAHHRNCRSQNVFALLNKYQSDTKHAQHVTFLAQEIFRQTKGIVHEYSDSVGYLLWSAAMLHDIGFFIARKGHHKHTHYLIRNEGLLGHSEEEVELIAAIARYHRGADPVDAHPTLATLPAASRKMVGDLAAILRLAEALDRSHQQHFERIDVEAMPRGKKEKVEIALRAYSRPGDDCSSEAWAFAERKKLFESQFKAGITLHVVASAKLPVVNTIGRK
jgi:exopolyphosphatase/guanosine-5'-triphosphate,3'-diphosphate pyrophosphatase